MQVFKFGGASVKDANGVKNVLNVINLHSNKKLVVVVSAMGKTTNALEEIANHFYYQKTYPQQAIQQLKDFHYTIVNELFTEKQNSIYTDLQNVFVELDWIVEAEPENTYNYAYDQIVSLGEMLSTNIVAAYLKQEEIDVCWQDARDLIHTDNNYRDANVDWELTVDRTNKIINSIKNKVVVTQGFIGTTSENYTTTLGREGSDYTAAILAYALNAESVTIWKDVVGVLNADPKFFSDAVLLNQISYLDAIELAYYGATVIHPKTIKPLQNKNITLCVKSFLAPKAQGTIINSQQSTIKIPSYIFKINQVLLSISPKDFSFIAENNLIAIFSVFSKHSVKINLMQNSAISFSVCFDNVEGRLENVIKELKLNFKVLYNKDVKLVTIRHYNQEIINKILEGESILLEQKSRNTVQLVL